MEKKTSGAIDNFIKILKETYTEGLVSVILYGSLASGEYVDKHSNINLLVVLDDDSLDNLKKISKFIKSRKYHTLHPVFFTQDYIRRSVDVFPVEFLDMKENHSVLFGKDVLKDLEIGLKNLRFQCEQELKAKLINLKLIYLKTRDLGSLKNLLLKSFTSVVHLLRNLVRLRGNMPAYLKKEFLAALGNEFRIDTSNFTKILELKQNKLKLNYAQMDSLFLGFARDLEKIVELVDRL